MQCQQWRMKMETASALQISTTGVTVQGTLDVTGSVQGVPHVDYRGNYSHLLHM